MDIPIGAMQNALVYAMGAKYVNTAITDAISNGSLSAEQYKTLIGWLLDANYTFWREDLSAELADD